MGISWCRSTFRGLPKSRCIAIDTFWRDDVSSVGQLNMPTNQPIACHATKQIQRLNIGARNAASVGIGTSHC